MGIESERERRRRQITEMSNITDMHYWSQVHTLYIHVRPMMCYIHTLSILVWEEWCYPTWDCHTIHQWIDTYNTTFFSRSLSGGHMQVTPGTHYRMECSPAVIVQC